MKKLIALLLALLTVLSLFGCGAKEAEPTAAVEQKRDYSAFANIVADPKTWYDELMALPN